jgi:hypothetical protein
MLLLVFSDFKKNTISWMPVAYIYNPSYSEGRDQEDHGSKPARANSSQDPISKMPNAKIGLVEWLKYRAPTCLASMKP